MLSEKLDTLRPAALVIDNDASSRKLMGVILEREGFSSTLAANAAQALEHVETLPQPPSLIISDIFLGETNGVDVVARIRPRWPEAAVLFTSGFSEAALKDRGWVLNEPFIEKPVCIRRLRALLAQVRARSAEPLPLSA